MSSIFKFATLWKILLAWLVMLLVSIANGAIRDFSYGQQISELAAHQISTASGIVLLGMVIAGYCRLTPPSSAAEAISLGLFWVGLTLAFEFLFFHYVGGHSWSALLANYNVLEGRVWVLLLAWIAVAPSVFFSYSTRRHKQKDSP
ncbi:MAG: hypothetical protein WCK63_12860 [Betaproteobacteria bacterium]